MLFLIQKEVTTKEGNYPLVVTVPHGGLGRIPQVNIRENSTTTTDDNLLTVARLTIKELKEFGIKPHLIALNVSRKYVDVNRPPGEMAYECDEAKQIWIDYHDKIDASIKKCLKKYGKCFLLDLHGQSHPENCTEIGYGLKTDDLESLSNGILKKPSTITDSLDAKHVKELIMGPNSLGEILTQNGLPATPRNEVIPKNTDNYFAGGYTVRKYCTGKTQGAQVEFSFTGSRDNDKNINSLAKIFASSLIKFLDKNNL